MTTTTTDQVQAWTYLVTLAIPFVAALVNRPEWSSQTKRWVTIAVATVFGVVTMWLQAEFTDLTTENALQHVVLIVGATQIWYSAIQAVPFAKSALTKLESVGAPKPPEPVPPAAGS